MENKEIAEQTRELINKIHEAMKGYMGPIRFMALSNVVGAGIIAYGDEPEMEAQVLGAFMIDVTETMNKLRDSREEAQEMANAMLEKEDAETH